MMPFRMLVVVVLPLMHATVGTAMEPTLRDVTYAVVDGHELKLDLYLPGANESKDAAPLIVWVHGGAWRAGSKASVPILDLVSAGFAIASVDYRLSTEAPFPAQVHDIKAAIRFLRHHAADYQLDADRFSLTGASAGGHLAALTGVSANVAELEGKVGEHLQERSDVGHIVSFYGASNLQTILSQSTPHGLSVRVPALTLLLGGPPEDRTELLRLASPVVHVDKHDPPLLLIHGDQDPQMPINQSHELFGRYTKLGLTAEFDVVYGGAHGGPEFYSEDRLRRVAAFLNDNPK
ncbi:MAG: alpha/beta hydrolase [Planctomycetaceae bacterium]